jgi:hypothetical protein
MLTGQKITLASTLLVLLCLQKRLKEAINLEQAGAVTAGKATLQKGKERARWVLFRAHFTNQ